MRPRKSDPLREKLVRRYNAAMRRVEEGDVAATQEALQLRRLLRTHDRQKAGK